MTDKPSIVEALAAVMTDVKAVGKTGHNASQNYNFRGIDAVVNAVGPVLRTHSVIVLPEVLEASYRDVQTSTGKPSRECTVRVAYTFHGPAGDSLRCVTCGEAMDSGDKGTPKAMSVAFRVALLQALCLPTDEPDPDSQSYERDHAPAQVDPLVALKKEIVRRGQMVNLVTTDDLAAKFAELNGGLVLSDATQPELNAFLSWLEKEFTRGQQELSKVAGVNRDGRTKAGTHEAAREASNPPESLPGVPENDPFYSEPVAP